MKSKLLEQELFRKDSPFDFIGKSKQLQDILALIQKGGAHGLAPVLIQGESGTGKELSRRRSISTPGRPRPFVALNCASLPENLIESELFGHEKGAFTGAYQTKHGLFELADKGTLFWTRSASCPSGSSRSSCASSRRASSGGWAATRRCAWTCASSPPPTSDLNSLIKTGTFREDLYYRLNVINVPIPPLRERKEDVVELSHHFLKKYAKKLSKPITEFTSEALDLLTGYNWPGNVRELENVVERAVILCESGRIGAEDLSISSYSAVAEISVNPSLEEIEKTIFCGC